jgi:hypothetical protein
MRALLKISLLGNVVLVLVCLGVLLRGRGDEGRGLDVRLSSIPVKHLAVLGMPGIGGGPEESGGYGPIEALAVAAPFVTRRVDRAYPVRPPAEVTGLLETKKRDGQTDHLGYLVEYGLRVHLGYLEHTELARELPLESNLMLAELVRVTELAKYSSAHEAGWLNDQFYGEFDRTGYSSYQIYIWAKEHRGDIALEEERFPNARRINRVLEAIDNSSRNGVGGDGVCHYWCL